jgi:hypothetical protein
MGLSTPEAEECALCNILKVFWNCEGEEAGQIRAATSARAIHLRFHKEMQGGDTVPHMEFSGACSTNGSMQKTRLSPARLSKRSDKNAFLDLAQVKEWISYYNNNHDTNEACISTLARYPSAVKSAS